jgi:NitT/TauT family transport system substrate-binding protein
MAQAVMASDSMIASKPKRISYFVQALLHALDDIKRDPQAAARAFIAAQPSYQGQEASVARIFAYYAANVYSGQPRGGEFDRARIEQLQQYYLGKRIIRRASPVDDLFTNQFLP